MADSSTNTEFLVVTLPVNKGDTFVQTLLRALHTTCLFNHGQTRLVFKFANSERVFSVWPEDTDEKFVGFLAKHHLNQRSKH